MAKTLTSSAAYEQVWMVAVKVLVESGVDLDPKQAPATKTPPVKVAVSPVVNTPKEAKPTA